MWTLRSQSGVGEINNMGQEDFLPGVAVEHVLARIDAAAGKELESGKLLSPESSSALAVNAFGWFIDRPQLLPALPGMEGVGVAQRVEVEYCARFPWSGGRHPWLDAAIEYPGLLVGIESKRFEPFRDTKSVRLSDAYDRPVWGDAMRGFERMRDALRSGAERFVHLDGVQLVKHAFGLVTDGKRRGRAPVLFYLFAEPAKRAGVAISRDDVARHREEIQRFSCAVGGDAVSFKAASYREWIGGWAGDAAIHGQAVLARFQP
jgi:hypothetical protein